MMKWSILFFAAFCLVSCVKDDVNVDELITNPLDSEYTGPSYIDVTSSTVFTEQDNSKTHVVNVVVDNSNFPPGTDYDLFVKEIGSGDEEQVVATVFNGNEFVYRNFNITQGQEYCYEFSIWVSYSTGRTDTFCDTL